MTARITHHIPPDMLSDWAAGRLAPAFAVVVAAHVSLCDDCRAAWEAEDLLAGGVLGALAPVAVSPAVRDSTLALLDLPPSAVPAAPHDTLPTPVAEILSGAPVRWQSLGGGIRQQILLRDPDASLRLLHIPPGRKVPEHGHQGLELTLVLQGSFSDSEGHFHRGDVECARDEINHQPVAGPGEPCICLAATDAPLRFHSVLPRLLQPLFRI